MVAAISFVAERVRSVGVSSGASRLRRSSEVFVELRLFIVWSCLVSFQSYHPFIVRTTRKRTLPLCICW